MNNRGPCTLTLDQHAEVCGCFGGMGGCAMIGQSMINIGSGREADVRGKYNSAYMARVRGPYRYTGTLHLRV